VHKNAVTCGFFRGNKGEDVKKDPGMKVLGRPRQRWE
jgi:hypothetical protein